MDNKITIQTFTEALAQSNGLSSAKAEAFVRAVFDVIAQNVVTDGLVKVKALGTFKLIEVLQRESIDVSTGKRIIIPGHTKISFTPDSALRDQVNRPFADFQTVILNDETSIEDMERMDSSSVLQSEALPSDDALVSEGPYVEETLSQNDEDDAQIEVTSENPESVSDEESSSVEPEPETEMALTPEIIGVDIHQENSVTEAEAHPEETDPTHDDNIPGNQLQDVSVTEQQDAFVANTDVPTSEIETYTEDKSMEEVKFSVNSELLSTPQYSSRNSTIWFYLFYILLTLVLMTGSYFIGYFRVLCPSNPAVEVQAKVPATEKKDSIKAEPKVVQPKPHDLYPQVPGGKYIIVGTRKVREMKVGDNLFKIAREEYGDKEFAQYIIVYNQFTNPDVISKGHPIKLPELQEVK